MAKEIRYPTQEWIDEWVDKYLDAHPDEKVGNFQELEAQAQDAWWLNEVEHDRPTPFDLTKEQEKASKEVRKGMASADKPRKAVVRERKPNDEKRFLIDILGRALTASDIANVVVTNAEKTIDFTMGENRYTVMLTCHRKPKS